VLLKEESRQEYQSRINHALDFINNNLNEEISLNDMSAAAFFSPFHFHRIFVATMGETPSDYLRRLRLEKAANMLASYPQLAITDIASDCGFSSSAVFARSFRSYFGISAQQWRKRKDGGLKRATDPGRGGKTPPDYKIIRQPSQGIKIEIKSLPEFNIAYLRCLTGYNQGIGKTWDKLFKWAGPRDLLRPDTTMLGIPLDNPDITPQGKCRYYACLTVPKEIKPQGEVSIMQIKSTRYAVYHFKGSGKQINEAYRYLYAWLPESGWEPQDKPALEIYSGPPENKVLRYDICLPVKPLFIR
jgi:AraC family transcriptional regulator